ncbi:MAG: EAL domain-containing protein, partial [Zoogloea sp.]|nr:EAL domain-containing protein [Zoogloea sp.]
QRWPELAPRLRRDREARFETSLQTLAGETLSAEVHLLLPATPDAGWLMASVHDQSEHKRDREKLRRIIDENVDGVLVLGEHGDIRFVNPAAAALFGRKSEELIGQDFGLPMLVDKMSQIDVVRQGRPVPVEMRITRFSWPDRPAFLVSLHDLSERVRYEEALRHKTTHDELTDLPARPLLEERLDHAIYAAERAGTQVAVMMLDIDRFRVINESLGHAAGDAVLKTVAEHLKAYTPVGHTVARLGGDKFVFVMDGLIEEQEATRLAQNLRAAVSTPMEWQGVPVPLSATLGISLFPKDGDTAERLVVAAEIALEHAKERGRGGFAFNSPALDERAQQRMAMEGELRNALANGELEMFYQPRVNLANGLIAGAEALMRWNHPTRGLMPPSQFMAMAEENGLIIPITQWAFHDVCSRQRAWDDSGMPAVPVAVNLSAYHFRRGDVLGMVHEVMNDTGVRPALIEVELTETALMDNADESVDILDAMKALGILIALDDFGTGYSSLSYLQRFPIDILKIDASFVRRMESRRSDAAIVAAIVT